MNLPNQLTLLRIVIAFILIFFLLIPGFEAKAIALGLFVLASLTDLLDGKLARKWGKVTDFGILMDPIADKILVLSCFMAFVQLQIVPAWMVVLIATREFLVTGVRFFALSRGHVLPAEAAGKHKTVSQIVAISLTLLFLVIRESAHSAPWMAHGPLTIWLLTFVTVCLTMTSGVSFLWKHRKLIMSL